MKASTRNNLKVWAIAWLKTRIAPEYPTQYQQKAIAIHHLLSDGEWHNAKEIGNAIGLCDRSTRNLVGVLKEPFSFASNTSKGYMMVTKDSKSNKE